MIRVILSDKKYKIDIYHLVKAFYLDRSLEFVYEVDDDKGDTPVLKVICNTNRITIEYIYKKDSQWDKIIDFMDVEAGISTKSQYKNAMKRLLYSILNKVTGVSLPWGILTGIRPTKLVYGLLEQGKDDQRVIQYMKDEFLCSEDRINISLEIAKRERKLLNNFDYKNGYSLYVGIPFCPSTCLYCSFTSFSIDKYLEDVDAYLKALEKEIIYGATCLPKRTLNTVYIGGGTPTTLSASQLDWLLYTIKKHFDFSDVREFSVEAGRPDSITKEKLLVLKKHGVDRISINPQSMKQETLDLIGRKHTVAQVREAFWLAREAGHDNINMDLIIGLPGEGPEDVEETLLEIEKLNPDSLTVHTLAIKRAARLNNQRQQFLELRPTDVPTMMEKTVSYARKHGYLPYYLYRQKNMADNLENISYARKGKEGLYNILIMEEQQTILGLGAGAISKFVFHDEKKIQRVYNVKNINDYISRIDEMICRKKDFIEKNNELGM